MNQVLPVDRFLHTLEIVAYEGKHLAYSWERLNAFPIDPGWVRGLESAPEMAERLEAFVSRFGRMQDTIADKLIPQWLASLAEKPGSLIENLNRAEKLGVLDNVEEWLEALKLRNRLVHEYMQSPESFAEDLTMAKEYCNLLVGTYNRFRDDARMRMEISEEKLPEKIVLGEA
ncbi:MAG TPA: hypothetical protein ENJ84_06165 [Gammaproteobacteria bacterium]|nr:hypothetical protein [Gammaproteobacteria bacterium]